jgi:anti-sigma B factor antagonist
VIYCPERIVAGATEELHTAAKDAIEDTARVVLQLEPVRHIDSTGLGLLAWLCVSARKRSGDVKLVAPPPHVKQILELSMIGRVFTVYPTVEAAVAAFSPTSQAQ